MPAVPTWRSSSDVTLVAPISLSAAPGSTGTATVLHYWNNMDGGGATDIPAGRFKILLRNPGEESYAASGMEWLDLRYVEMRITGGLGGLSVGSTDWKPLGGGSYLDHPAIPNDRGLVIEVRIKAPFSAAADTMEAIFRDIAATGEVIADGLTESGPDGIFLGLGDGNQTVLVRSGNVVQNPLGADDEVQVQETVGICAGVAAIARQQMVEIPVAAAGLGRYDLLSLKSDNTITRTAGTEVALPLDDDDKPTVPDGEIPLAYIHRTESGNVENDDITNIWAFGLYGFTSSGLSGTVGLGPSARIDNWLTHNLESQQVNLEASETNYIWLQRAGTLAVTTDGLRPADQPRALLIWEAVTDGSSVTVLRDRRFYVGHRVHCVEFDWIGNLVVDEYRYRVLPAERAAQIVPVYGALLAAVGVQAVTPASGQTRFTVEAEHSTGVWTNLFATAANRPTIAFDATVLKDEAAPDRLDLPAECRLRARVTELPAGAATPPKDGHLVLAVAL